MWCEIESAHGKSKLLSISQGEIMAISKKCVCAVFSYRIFFFFNILSLVTYKLLIDRG